MSQTVLRDLHTLDDYRQVVELQYTVWGFTDANDIVTLPVFIITVKRGGVLVGAFDEQERMVGFVFSIVGLRGDRTMHWSHMLAVLPEYRQSGLGRQLKLAQRERVLALGLDLIEWTFDPLQTLNAHFNFTRLGVVADEYCRNVYGESTSALHKGTPTDRLIVQWNVRAPHVERRIGESNVITVRPPEVVAAPVINRTELVGGRLAMIALDLSIEARRAWLEIPIGFTEMQQETPALALEWRMQTREAFESYLGRGYRVVDFVLDRAHGRGRYLLTS
jgi:predicted GNAT superfamily acetyltransferase